MIDWVTIERHYTPVDMYDDGGYCDTKIKRGGVYYWFGVADGNGEKMCSECALSALLYQLQNGGNLPAYTGLWLQDFEGRQYVSKEGQCRIVLEE